MFSFFEFGRFQPLANRERIQGNRGNWLPSICPTMQLDSKIHVSQQMALAQAAESRALLNLV